MGKRGPPPRQLAKLFRLKYLQEITDKDELARLLDITKDSVYAYESRLKRKLIKKIKQVSPDRLRFVCPECLEARVIEDHETGERVCSACGYILDEEVKMVHTLPFDETYAVVNPLVFNKSLGGTLPSRSLYRVIARTPDGKRRDVPIRQIRAIHELHDPPLIKRMKEYAEDLRKRSGLDVKGNPVGDPDTFSVSLGQLIEKVGSRAIMERVWGRRGKELAEACFVVAVEMFNPRARVEGLKLRKRALVYVKALASRKG